MTFTSLKFQLWAVIDDVEVDVVQYTGSFELNRIPKALVVLPVGVEARTLQLSHAHVLAADTQIHKPAKVFVRILRGGGLGNERALAEEGTYLLFEGHATGVGYRRSTTGLNMALELTHWLSALTFSSILSESSHPGNPYLLTFDSSFHGPADVVSGFGGELPDAGVASVRHWTGLTLAQQAVTEATLTEDMWGEFILPWFKELAGTDRLLLNPRLFGTEEAEDAEAASKNDSAEGEAAAALERFDGDKLPLDVSDTDTEIVAKVIAEDFAVSVTNPTENTNHFAALANTTFWDKLVGDLGQRYMFSVVPFPDRAKVVPFIPGLQETHNPREEKHSILARDIRFLDINSQLPRPLRALGIIAGKSSDFGADMTSGSSPISLDSVSGMYVGRDDGLVMFKVAPRFLTDIGIPWTQSLATSGIQRVRADAFSNPRGSTPSTVKSFRETRNNFKSLLDRMAQTMYAFEHLKQRVGQVAGAVRFDICPGSTISVEGTASRYIRGNDPIGEVRYGTVLRVTHFFDAEAQAAGTAFLLGHVRNEQENKDKDTSIEQHPLYDRKWKGDVLVTRLEKEDDE